MAETDRIPEWLIAADEGAGGSPMDGNLAFAALRRAGVRRFRRRVWSSAAGLVLVTCIGVAIVRPWTSRNTEVARLRSEVAELREKSDRLAAEIAALRQSREIPRDRLVRSAFAEERNRAAFAMVRTADQCKQIGGASDVANATYRRVEGAFPETTWASHAREELKDSP